MQCRSCPLLRCPLRRFSSWSSNIFPRWKRCARIPRMFEPKVFGFRLRSIPQAGLDSFHLWIRVSSPRLEPHIPTVYLSSLPASIFSAKFCFAVGFLTTFLAGNVVLILFESWDQVFCVQLRLFQLDFTLLSSLETLYSSYSYWGAEFCFPAGFLTTSLAGNVVLILFESWDQVFCVQLRSIPQAGLGSHRRAALFRFPSWISHYFPRWKRCTHPMRILGAKFSVSASEHSSGRA